MSPHHATICAAHLKAESSTDQSAFDATFTAANSPAFEPSHSTTDWAAFGTALEPTFRGTVESTLW